MPGQSCPRAFRLAAIVAALALSAVPTDAGGDRRGLGFRLGMRASPSDVSPVLGLSWAPTRVVLTGDWWIRPLYWKTKVWLSPTHFEQVRELRHGIVAGLRYEAGDRDFGVMPGAGMEWVGGDYAGKEADPEYEFQPWAGLALRMARSQTLGARVMMREGVLGWFRIEWIADFR